MCDACGDETLRLDDALARARALRPELPWYIPLTWTPNGDGVSWRSERGGYTITEMANGEAMLSLADGDSRVCADRSEAEGLADGHCWKREPRTRLL